MARYRPPPLSSRAVVQKDRLPPPPPCLATLQHARNAGERADDVLGDAQLH